MLDTLQGLVIGLGFLVPGVVFELGIERVVGYWRTSLGDRLFRFFAESVIFQTLAAALTYVVVRHYDVFPSMRHVTLWGQVTHRYGHLPWLAWLVAVGYVLVPFVLGFGAGSLVRTAPDGLLSRVIVGRDLPPRAWDYLFSRQPACVVRARRDGHWVAGLYTSTEDDPGITTERFVLCSVGPTAPARLNTIRPAGWSLGSHANGSCHEPPRRFARCR